MAVERDWRLRKSDPAAVATLVRELGVTELVARLLVNRRLDDPDEARRFLAPRLSEMPDPFSMKGMDRAVDRILAAIDAGESICVWGDYDVDGVTSSSQLLWFFRAIGAEVRYHVPDRFTDGYGLNGDGIRALVSEGVGLIITVDCGISNVREVALANELGADVIVVDHHQIPPVLPPAYAILNPVQADCAFPDKRLAACGVTFVLIVALRARMRATGRFAAGDGGPDLRDWLDLTAIGTIADMVPLVGLNRVITTVGLKRVGTSRRPGVRALCEVSRLRDPHRITAGVVGFQLGPRINAAGRMAHASAGVELMTTESVEAALEVANGVDAYNLERRAVQAEIFEQAVALADAHPDPANRRAIVLAAEGWHSGVLGIVASKMVERYHRPTILMTIEGGAAKGSARSISGFKLVAHLAKLEAMLDKYGGHDHAAGLSLQATGLQAFTDAFEAEARATLEDRHLRPRLRIDAEVPLDWVGHPLIADTQQLAPFGQGNPEPVYLARGVLVHEARLVGEDQRHVKLRLGAGHGTIDGIAFGQSESAPQPGDLIDLAYVPELNHFRDNVYLQVRVKAMRPAGIPVGEDD